MERRLAGWVLGAAAVLLAAGCTDTLRPSWPAAGVATPSVTVMADDAEGPVLLGFTALPVHPEAPAEGLRSVFERVADDHYCAAALFPWTELDTARRWLQDQLRRRRPGGKPAQLVLVGHGMGGTQAVELAKSLLTKSRKKPKPSPEPVIVLLATVDAIKSGWVSRPMGMASAAVGWATPLPSADRLDFIAYNGAPRVGGRLRAHVNYYQTETTLRHGGPMDHAENHRLGQPGGGVTHDNADQYAVPFLSADIRQAIRQHP